MSQGKSQGFHFSSQPGEPHHRLLLGVRSAGEAYLTSTLATPPCTFISIWLAAASKPGDSYSPSALGKREVSTRMEASSVSSVIRAATPWGTMMVIWAAPAWTVASV